LEVNVVFEKKETENSNFDIIKDRHRLAEKSFFVTGLSCPKYQIPFVVKGK